MNIHCTLDAAQERPSNSRFTTDRFGKKHAVLVKGRKRSDSIIKSKEIILLVVLFLSCMGPPAFASQKNQSPGNSVSYEYETESGARDVDAFLNKDGFDYDSYGSTGDESLGVALNDDGDPDVGMKF